MSGADSAGRKQEYFARLVSYLNEYSKVMVVGVDNIGSNHMQKIRKSLRGKGVVLMGKNTMIRKVIRGHLEANPKLEVLLPLVRGNVGFVFVKDDLSFVKKVLEENRVSAPARVGSIAPNDVIVPAGPTGLEPTQTSFLQALNIASRIAKGSIEIINDVPLIKTGEKVNNSQATLLQKLNINPFSYGLVIKNVYDDGALYDAKVLDITPDEILKKFAAGVTNLACVSLAVGLPTVASIPHSIARGAKNILAVGLIADLSFPALDRVKAILANPGAHAAAPAPTSAPAKDTKKKEEPKEVKKEEEEEEVEGMGGLFD
jgi:large subunit ribosomal protein LP0